MAIRKFREQERKQAKALAIAYESFVEAVKQQREPAAKRLWAGMLDTAQRATGVILINDLSYWLNA